jgi:methionine biosynthesis protein MetW
MTSLKIFLRRLPPYLWLAERYRSLRRLVIYPATARVGLTDYDDYWDAKLGRNEARLSPYRRARAEALARIVPHGGRVLELGVGDGGMLKYLIDHAGVDGSGLDISPKAVEFCRSIGLQVDLADANQPLGAEVEGHYDAILMCELIEHLPDPEAVLDRLRERADLLVISIPNTGYYQHRLRLLLGRFPLQWVVTPGEHLRFWTVIDFRWWADQLGFRIVAQEAYVGTPGLRRVWPNLFGQGMIYALSDMRETRS